MTIAIDGSTPADVKLPNSTSTTATTASFSPPANSLVVIAVNFGFDSNTNPGPTVAVADSGSVSYTAGPSGYDGAAEGAYLFSNYYASAPGSITVTVTRSGTGATTAAMYNVKPWVLTGCASSQAGAASNSGHNTTGTGVSASVTPASATSWLMMAASVAGSSTTMTPLGSGVTDGTYADTGDGTTGVGGHTPSAGTSPVTVGWTAGTSTFWAFAALEVLPAGAPAGLPPSSGMMSRPVLIAGGSGRMGAQHSR